MLGTKVESLILNGIQLEIEGYSYLSMEVD